jgi:hypothetical protein
MQIPQSNQPQFTLILGQMLNNNINKWIDKFCKDPRITTKTQYHNLYYL